jgi:hypothetical protein
MVNLDANTVLTPANVDLLVQELLIFSTCTEIKNCRYIKPNNIVVTLNSNGKLIDKGLLYIKTATELLVLIDLSANNLDEYLPPCMSITNSIYRVIALTQMQDSKHRCVYKPASGVN